MTSFCLYLAVTPVSAVAFDQIEEAHRNLSAASFSATTAASGPGQNLKARYAMAYRWPSALRLRTLDPSSGRVERERMIERSRIIDYDPELMQYVVERRDSKDSLGKTLAELDRDLDDLILGFTAPDGIEVWMTDLKKLSPWRVTYMRQSYSLTYKKGDKRIVLGVEKAGSRLSHVEISTGPQKLTWNLSYGKPESRLAFRPPSGATEVPLFDREMKPPSYADKTAQRVAERMFDAYSELTSLGFEVTRDTGSTKVQIMGKFVKQEDARYSWTFDGRTLNFHDKGTNTWHTGKFTNFPDVVDAVGDLGTRVDPTARLLMSRFNPYRKRLGDGVKIKVAGTMPLDGRQVTILECESEMSVVTLFVREDGFVASSSTRAKQGLGDPDETVNLRYRYFTVPKDAPSKLALRAPLDAKPLEKKLASR